MIPFGVKNGTIKKKNAEGSSGGQRFKSLIVENGDTLINCLAYIDLNPVRANIVDQSEEYRWNTLGYLLQTGNKDDFLSLEFGLNEQENLGMKEKIEKYREFVHEIGALPTSKRKSSEKCSVNMPDLKSCQSLE